MKSTIIIYTVLVSIFLATGGAYSQEELIDKNAVKYTTVYVADDGVLTKTETPDKVVPKENTYNIDAIKKQIAKIDSVILLWQEKRAPLQALVDKYDELNPVEEEPIFEE